MSFLNSNTFDLDRFLCADSYQKWVVGEGMYVVEGEVIPAARVARIINRLLLTVYELRDPY